VDDHRRMASIPELLPDVEALLALEPEEVAGVVLQYLVGEGERSSTLNRYNFGLSHTVNGYPSEKQEAASRALMEAWVWLEREGLIAPKPGDSGHWVFVTRRGRSVATPERLHAYRLANLLPKRLLHPQLVQRFGPHSFAVITRRLFFKALRKLRFECDTSATSRPLMWESISCGRPSGLVMVPLRTATPLVLNRRRSCTSSQEQSVHTRTLTVTEA
jgi:hypothetical protein